MSLRIAAIITADASGFKAGLGQARGELGQLVTVAGQTGGGVTAALRRGLSGLGGTVRQALAAPLQAARDFSQGFVGSIGGALATVGAGIGLKSIVDTNVEFQRLKASLDTVTGSAEAGAAAFAKIERFATTTPFSLNEVVTAFTRMQSLGIEPTEERLTSFGNTASAMGTTLVQFTEAVADASVGEFERLKEFGIKARAQGDQVALTFQGNTTTIARSAEAITAYLEEIGSNQFAGALERQMSTLPGLFSNLGDSFGALSRQIGEGGLNAGLQELLSALIGLTQEGGGLADAIGASLGGVLSGIAGAVTTLTAAFQGLSPNMQEVVLAVGGFAAAAAPLVPALALLVAAIGALLSPIGLVVLAVGGLAAAYVAFGDDVAAFLDGVWTRLRDAFEAAVTWVTTTRDGIVAGFAAIVATFVALKDQALTAVAELIAGVQGYLVGRLTAIADRVRQPVEAVTGFFRDMYQAIYGGSYVPDMVDGIAAEMGRLDVAMVDPAMQATSELRAGFADLSRGVGTEITGMIRTGEASLSGFADFVDKAVARVLDRLISSGIDSAIGSLVDGGDPAAGGGGGLGGLLAGLFAEGAAFDRGRVVPFAKGGIVARPTVFPFARGVGLMGEAGPEAIMPLTRLPGGDLGVAAAGGGRQAPVQVSINVVNQAPGAEATASSRRGADGRQEIEILVREVVRSQLGRGEHDGALSSRYGLSPTMRRR